MNASSSSLLRRIRTQKRPVRFMLSRMLWRTGLCRHFTIDRGTYRLRFFPSTLSAEYWTNQDERRDDERFLMAYLRSGETVVDVGANVGSISLAAAAAVGDSGHVYAIEPHPTVFGYLQSNIALNHRRNITPLNIALSNAPGELCFTDLRSDDCNGVVARSTLKVPTHVLDSLLERDIAQVALLKVDVEGYEKFVFEGGAQLLERTACVYFEVWDQHAAKYGYKTADILRFLHAHRFTILRFAANQQLDVVSDSYQAVRCENMIAVRDVDFLRARLAGDVDGYA